MGGKAKNGEGKAKNGAGGANQTLKKEDFIQALEKLKLDIVQSVKKTTEDVSEDDIQNRLRKLEEEVKALKSENLRLVQLLEAMGAENGSPEEEPATYAEAAALPQQVSVIQMTKGTKPARMVTLTQICIVRMLPTGRG